jgi:hypothetical protein
VRRLVRRGPEGPLPGAERAEILESAKACGTGDGVVVLTDMFGGTPSNLAISIMGQAGGGPQVHHHRLADPRPGSFVDLRRA